MFRMQNNVGQIKRIKCCSTCCALVRAVVALARRFSSLLPDWLAVSIMCRRELSASAYDAMRASSLRRSRETSHTCNENTSAMDEMQFST